MRKYLLPVIGLLFVPLAVFAITIPSTTPTLQNVNTNVNTQAVNTNDLKANANQAANQVFTDKKDAIVAKCNEALNNTKATDLINSSDKLNSTEKQALNACVADSKAAVSGYCQSLNNAANLEELEAATRAYLDQVSVTDGALASCVNAVLVTGLQELADLNAFYLQYVTEVQTLYCPSNPLMTQTIAKGNSIQKNLQAEIDKINADGQVNQADNAAVQTASIHAAAKYLQDIVIYETAYTCMLSI